MPSHRRTWPSASGILLLATLATAQTPLQIPFNTSGVGFGPDGPWNFITLSIGSGPASNVDFYLKIGEANSLLIKSNVCVNQTSCLNPKPGYYNQSSSSGTRTPQAINSSSLTVTQFDAGLSDELGAAGNGNYWIDTINGLSSGSQGYQNISFFVSNNITVRYGGGIPYNPVSLLSLEPSTGNSSPIKTPDNDTVKDQTLIEAYSNSTSGSLSFGLHMGSMAFQQPGSLYIGGYDSNRIIETPATFTKFGAVPLNTLTFGTASGSSPWVGQTLPSNFLGAPIEVLVQPQVPYIYLGQNVCDTMKEFLPITYDNDTNLFLWNTEDPAYQAIVTSPSYLNFTFGDSKNTSIRVPFALLNLTLNSPLKSQPTQYFPCSPRFSGFNLGRAFLQAAFLSQSYIGSGTIQVAQAPGPSINVNTKPNPVQIFQNNPDTQPPPNAPEWEDTWEGILLPLAGTSSTNSTSGGGSNAAGPALSGGAIAGIVVGALAGVVLFGGAVAYCCRRKSRGDVSVVHSPERPTSAGSDIPPPPPLKDKFIVSRRTSRPASSRFSPPPPRRDDGGIIPIPEMAPAPLTAAAAPAAESMHEMDSNELPPEMEAESSHLAPAAPVHELPGSSTGNTRPSSTANTRPTSTANTRPTSTANAQPVSTTNTGPTSNANTRPESTTNTRSTNTRAPVSRNTEPAEMDGSRPRTPNRE